MRTKKEVDNRIAKKIHFVKERVIPFPKKAQEDWERLIIGFDTLGPEQVDDLVMHCQNCGGEIRLGKCTNGNCKNSL